MFYVENDAHGGTAFQPDGGPGGIVHTGEGGFELQTSLLTDKGNSIFWYWVLRNARNLNGIKHSEQLLIFRNYINILGVVVGSATAAAVAHAAAAAAAAAAGQSGTVQNALELGQVQQTTGGAVPASITNTIGGSNSTSNRSQHGHQNNSGVCQICNKSFRQLRSHIQDVHNPTATPCPLCGKVFQSKHKMFGHKYRSCPNRTRNLVRHLEDIDPPGVVVGGAGGGGSASSGGAATQPSQTSQLVAVSAAASQQAQPGQQQPPAHQQQQPPPF